MDRIRGGCQDWVIQKMYRWTAKSIFTVPVDTIAWLPRDEDKAAFIPIGANIPEPAHRLRTLPLKDQEKTVIVFGVTGAPEMAREVADIAGIMQETNKTLKRLRLVVVGRGSIEAREHLTNALVSCNVDLTVRGVLPAEEIRNEFERADALLFIRGAITPQRGSAIAGIACGIPIVGYRPEKISSPFQEAGVEWSSARDPNSLARGLVRVLSDPHLWAELRRRNLEIQRNCFSWSRIAERYRMILIA